MQGVGGNLSKKAKIQHGTSGNEDGFSRLQNNKG